MLKCNLFTEKLVIVKKDIFLALVLYDSESCRFVLFALVAPLLPAIILSLSHVDYWCVPLNYDFIY